MKRLFLLLALVCWPLGAQDDRVALMVKGQQDGLHLVQPMYPVWFGIERISGAGAPAKGEALVCKPFKRHVSVVAHNGESVLLHDIALKCGDDVYVVRGVMLNPPERTP